tara:strand:- start:327 stop:1547 length:1221 start_codon:yes stop_codon:yes gene_type:complete
MTEKIAIKEVQGLEQESNIVSLFEIQLNATTKAFLTRSFEADLTAVQMYDFDTNTQLNTYTAIPIDIDGIDASAQGPSARPVVTIGTVNTDFQTLISPLSFEKLVGKKFYRRKTLAKYLKDGSADAGSGNTPIEFPRQVYVIDRVSQENAFSVTLELSSPFNVEGLVLPYRVVGHNACPWQYQGASPTKTEANKRGGCTWHEEGKYNLRHGLNGVTYQVFVNADDDYIIPSSTSFGAFSSSATVNSYKTTTTTLGASSGLRRLKQDGTIDTSADGSTVTNYWQATRATNVTPQDSHSDWNRIWVYSNYNASTTYHTYTDDRYNDYAITTSGTIQVWQRTKTGSGNTPQFGEYWQRGDLCGKRLSSCQCRFGFNPINKGTASSTGQTRKDTSLQLPFGGFPGARKFK